VENKVQLLEFVIEPLLKKFKDLVGLEKTAKRSDAKGDNGL
jgi:hypothetical protein